MSTSDDANNGSYYVIKRLDVIRFARLQVKCMIDTVEDDRKIANTVSAVEVVTVV